ncbi:replicative DNA helicase [uncultured Enterovirga sp.]|uniref:replicative DNA helicase n=1 Tax=uncultured Enterovirga sp. TaxID=2026352 RepID=UPI0035CA8D99
MKPFGDARADTWRNEVGLAVDDEQGLLGSLLMWPDSLAGAVAFVRPDHFIEPIHRSLFEAMADCHRAGMRSSIGEVKAALGKRAGASEVAPGIDLAAYMARLRDDGATAASTMDYARRVRANSAIRALASAIPDAGASGLPEDRLSAAFDRIDAIRAEVGEGAGSGASVGSIAQGVLGRAVDIAEGTRPEPGITTGLPDLDRAILGYRPGELIVAGGRPGMGKTTFATSSALKASDPHGQRTAGALFFGLELGAEAVGARCLADIAYDRFSSPTHSAIRAGRLDQHQIQQLRTAECRLNELDLEIDHRSIATVGEIEAKCRAVQRRFERQGKRLGVVFVDYLKQVKAGDRYRGNRVYEIGEITAGLRGLAKRLEICVVLLVQLNRGVEQREDKRPTLADLRESGDLENDADVVLLLYRPAYYLRRELQSAGDAAEAEVLTHKLEMAEHDLDVIVAKNRNGEGELSIPLFCDIGRSAVRSLARSGA